MLISLQIQNALERDQIDVIELIACLERLKEEGNVVVIKLDGERQEKQYTVFISFPVKLNLQMIRADEGSLIIALKKVLKQYMTSLK